MLPSPGWLLFLAFLALQSVIVLILVAPMPSNNVRGKVLGALLHVWNDRKIRYGCWGVVALCSWYFCDSVTTLYNSTNLWHMGCEEREQLHNTERNAYASGFSVLMFLVIRRLLEIQAQLFVLRREAKEALAKAAKATGTSTSPPAASPAGPNEPLMAKVG